MAHSRVAIIVLNYRGERVLRHCLASLVAAAGPEDDILVVDNGQEISPTDPIRKEFPVVEFLTLEHNRGFAAGMNAGLRQMQKWNQYAAYWLVNNDATVEPSALAELKRALATRGPLALYSPIILPGVGETPWYAGGKIDFLRMRTKHFSAPVSQDEAFSTSFLTGCALFIPASALDKIGALDERYFLYYEDAQYSLRARRAGLGLWVVPRSVVRHTEASRDNPEKIYWLVRSGAEFFLRESRGGWWLWVWIYYVLRRLKNTIDGYVRPSRLSTEVKRAYTDVSL